MAAATTDKPKPTGVIRGTVVDEHGVPVEKAVVRVTPMGRPLGYVSPWAETDAQGHFAIRKLDWGTWSTSASKPSEGYPDVSSVLYEKGGKFPVVVLSASSPAAEIEIQFAPKAGILTGRVSDSVTGAPIKASFELRRHGSSRFKFGVGEPSNYKVFLPASETVDMEVSAPGYQTAYFPGLNLSSGEEQYLKIKLRPSGERFYVDARGLSRGWQFISTEVGSRSNHVPEGKRKSRLQLQMVITDRPLHLGATVPMWFTVTNAGSEPLTVPISPNSVGFEPSIQGSQRSFQELIFSVQEDSPSGGPKLWTLVALYGDPSVPGTTRVLDSGESLVVTADLPIKPSEASPPSGIRSHDLNASASLEKVTVGAGNGAHEESRIELAHAESPLFAYWVLPPK